MPLFENSSFPPALINFCLSISNIPLLFLNVGGFVGGIIVIGVVGGLLLVLGAWLLLLLLLCLFLFVF